MISQTSLASWWQLILLLRITLAPANSSCLGLVESDLGQVFTTNEVSQILVFFFFFIMLRQLPLKDLTAVFFCKQRP